MRPLMFRPLDDASVGCCAPWKMHPGDASCNGRMQAKRVQDGMGRIEMKFSMWDSEHKYCTERSVK